jgi:hypothetical protein
MHYAMKDVCSTYIKQLTSLSKFVFTFAIGFSFRDITPMYLDGKSHDWCYHGFTTFGQNHIVAHTEFSQRLIDRFDQGDLEVHFRELTQLRQTGEPDILLNNSRD